MMNHTNAAAKWRDSFSKNAADLLQIYRWADGMTDEEFKHLLVVCFRRSPKAWKINEPTVCWALQSRECVKKEEGGR